MNSENNINSGLVRDIHKGKDGRLFLATDGGGLNVLDESTGRFAKYNYKIVHYESPDKRGIDVGLLYQSSIFEDLLISNASEYGINGGTSFESSLIR